MTVDAAKARGFATAVKGNLGWFAQCHVCPWEQPPLTSRYYSEAAFAARGHNLEMHRLDVRGGAK